MVELVQVLANSILLGCVYVVVSLGLSILFGILGIVNFAQGSLIIFGSYLAYVFVQELGLNVYTTIIPTMAAFLLVGIVVYYGYLRFIPARDFMRQIFGLVGLNLVIENGLLLVFGPQSVSLSNNAVSFVHMGPVLLNQTYLVAAGLAVILTVACFVILYGTAVGAKIRAVADNPVAAGLVGINRTTIYFVALSLGFVLTGAAGVTVATYYTLTPTGGAPFVILAFTAVVIGGLGSLVGTIVGAFSVSLVQNLTSVYLSPQLNYVMLFGVFMLVVIFRPQGILGEE